MNFSIKNDSKIIDIKTDKEIEFYKKENLNMLAKIINRETGINESSIYLPPRIMYINNWYKLNGKWCFYKQMDSLSIVNQFLGEKVSNYFDLPSAHYQLAKKDNKYGVVTPNFCEKNTTYKTLKDYKIKYPKDFDIFKLLIDLCSNEDEYNRLLNDIKKIMIRDLYTWEYDRTNHNLMFKEKSGIEVAPLYDYEKSFNANYLCPYIYSSVLGTFDLKEKDTQEFIRNDEMFQSLLNKLMDIDIIEMLSEIEMENDIALDEKLKDNYKDYNAKIKLMIRKNKLLR
ncbi:MAG: hypothetical protein IJ565_03590 [Bacilli bacterium]|nr:hypothetical protein [Bacilli bacterium]